MKLGFVTAILQDESFEEVVDFASEHGFRCIEVACWPKGKAERRYAGVTHIDVDALDDKKAIALKRMWRFPPWLTIPILWTRIRKKERKSSRI